MLTHTFPRGSQNFSLKEGRLCYQNAPSSAPQPSLTTIAQYETIKQNIAQNKVTTADQLRQFQQGIEANRQTLSVDQRRELQVMLHKLKEHTSTNAQTKQDLDTLKQSLDDSTLGKAGDVLGTAAVETGSIIKDGAMATAGAIGEMGSGMLNMKEGPGKYFAIGGSLVAAGAAIYLAWNWMKSKTETTWQLVKKWGLGIGLTIGGLVGMGAISRAMGGNKPTEGAPGAAPDKAKDVNAALETLKTAVAGGTDTTATLTNLKEVVGDDQALIALCTGKEFQKGTQKLALQRKPDGSFSLIDVAARNTALQRAEVAMNSKTTIADKISALQTVANGATGIPPITFKEKFPVIKDSTNKEWLLQLNPADNTFIAADKAKHDVAINEAKQAAITFNKPPYNGSTSTCLDPLNQRIREAEPNVELPQEMAKAFPNGIRIQNKQFLVIAEGSELKAQEFIALNTMPDGNKLNTDITFNVMDGSKKLNVKIIGTADTIGFEVGTQKYELSVSTPLGVQPALKASLAGVMKQGNEISFVPSALLQFAGAKETVLKIPDLEQCIVALSRHTAATPFVHTLPCERLQTTFGSTIKVPGTVGLTFTKK